MGRVILPMGLALEKRIPQSSKTEPQLTDLRLPGRFCRWFVCRKGDRRNGAQVFFNLALTPCTCRVPPIGILGVFGVLGAT